MRYRFKEIVSSIPPEKAAQDSIWTRFVLRPLSFPVTYLALALGLRANTVSYLSALFSLGGGVLLAWGDGFVLPLAGILILHFFSILDCVDGNIARVTKTAGPWGGWADAVMGFVAYTAVFIGSSVYEFLRSGWWPVLVIGALTSSANLLTRVAYQIYKNIVGESAHGSVSFERMLAENTGITGLLMPALLACHLAGRGMIIVILFNAAFYGGGCLASIVKIALKAPRGGGGGGKGLADTAPLEPPKK